jgi:hypothetical protein
VVDIGTDLVQFLRADPRRFADLSPEVFERFVANRLEKIGYDVILTGATTQRDGGVDLIAVPKLRTVASFLIAGQVKHHSGARKTDREAVDRLLAWKDSEFKLGLLVTNTRFTSDARWAAAQRDRYHFLRLRDIDDLRRWIQDNFSAEHDWNEIPEQVTLAPGITIQIPKPKVPDPFSIWRTKVEVIDRTPRR